MDVGSQSLRNQVIGSELMNKGRTLRGLFLSQSLRNQVIGSEVIIAAVIAAADPVSIPS